MSQKESTHDWVGMGGLESKWEGGGGVSLELRSQELENQLTFQSHKITGWIQLPSRERLPLEGYLC